MLLHARGVEHHTKGVENCLSYINLVLATRTHRQARLRLRNDHRPGERSGRPRAWPAVQSTCRERAISKIRNTANSSRTSGGSRNPSFRSTGLTACEIFDAIEARKDSSGLLSISFNPLVSIPDANRTRAALEKLEFLGCIDFFLSESGAICGRRPGRFAAGRRRRHRHHRRRPLCAASAVRHAAGRMRAWTGRFSRTSPRGWTARITSLTPCPQRHLSRARRRVQGRIRRLQRNDLRTRSRRTWASSGRALRSTIPARRGCLKADSFITRMAKRDFMDMNTGRLPKMSIPNIRSSSRLAASCRNT